MRRSGFAVLALTALILPLSATAATITVQPGETLTDIAYRSGVSVGTLMLRTASLRKMTPRMALGFMRTYIGLRVTSIMPVIGMGGRGGLSVSSR